MIDPKMLAILACPACRSSLTQVAETELRCQNGDGCGLIYRIEDDIPILLVEEARAPSDGSPAGSQDS